MPLLADPDRFIRFSARVAIEHGEIEKHRAEILAIKEPRPLVEGMLALVRATKLDEKQQDELLDREAALLASNVDPGAEVRRAAADRADLSARPAESRCTRVGAAAGRSCCGFLDLDRFTAQPRDGSAAGLSRTSRRRCR